MKKYCEITIVLSGSTDMVVGEAQKIFDACCEVEPAVFKHVDFEYFDLEVK